MYSEIEDGKVLDWHFKRNKVQSFIYSFYIDDIYVGQIFNLGRVWSAVSQYPGDLNNVSGFKTRHNAAEFLLKIRRYYRKQEKNDNELERRNS